ncbi:MAG: pyridoxal phosphate-dependent aminotransferase [Candidatus Brocadiae bacterium]|nr:pyridoxal phosphate-dependent aminotransferase [Candidatus Brocadiia bacterium]
MTLTITAKAASMREKGEDVVSLSAGEPDFDTPQPVKDAAIKAIREGQTKYTASGGIAALRRAIAEKLQSENGLVYDHTCVMVSNGAKQCLYNVISVVVDDGEEVLIPSPYWLSTPEMVKLAGGVPIPVPCAEAEGFALTAEAVRKAWTPKTRAIVINSPNNPTGAVYDDVELKAIGEFAIEKKMFVISDEIYEKLIYGGRKHTSILALVPGLREQAVVVNGFSKTWSMTGWRVGYIAGPKEVIGTCDRLQSHATSSTATPSQYAALAALVIDDAFTSKMNAEFNRRRLYCMDRIRAIPGLSAVDPHGAFYILIRIDSLFGRSAGGRKITGSLDFCDALLETGLVAAVPGVAFGSDRHFRISYATSLAALGKAFDRIETFVKSLA